MSTDLANKIVELRKENGKIEKFSDLWNIDEMNRQTMNELTKHFVIEKSGLPDMINKSNNSAKRQTTKKRKASSRKGKGRKNGRYLEHLPLLNTSSISYQGSDRLTVFTPRMVEASPSGDKILAMYEVTPSKKLPPNEKLTSSKLSTRNNAPSTSRFSVNSSNNLSPTKERSIRNWLKNSNIHQNWTKKKTQKWSERRSRSQTRKQPKTTRNMPAKALDNDDDYLDNDTQGRGKPISKTKTVTISNNSSPKRIQHCEYGNCYSQQPCCLSNKATTNMNVTPVQKPSQVCPRRDKFIRGRRRRSESAGSCEILVKSPAHERFVEHEYDNSLVQRYANTADVCNEIDQHRRNSVSPKDDMRGRYEGRQSPKHYGYSNHHDNQYRRSDDHHRSRHRDERKTAMECIVL